MLRALRQVKRKCGGVLHRPIEAARRLYRRAVLPFRIRHVHGPRRVDYEQGEVLVISVVRNGEKYLRTFVEHHTALGVKHIVLLDNGSTDGTIGLAVTFANVTVLRSDLPYRHFENLFKNYLARRFSKGRWNLCVDIDELFDYPGSESTSLGDFLGYLNARGFTAVVAQMLDLAADAPLSQLDDSPEDDVSKKYKYYNLSNITKFSYKYSRLCNEKVAMHFGGIRKTLFGSNNGLTKAALVRVETGIRLFQDWHHAENADVADVTCVLLHYPFTSTFYRKVKDAAETGRYGFVTTGEYESYWKRLSSEPDLNVRLPGSREYNGTSALIDEGFLVASPEYLVWVADHPKTPPAPRD